LIGPLIGFWFEYLIKVRYKKSIRIFISILFITASILIGFLARGQLTARFESQVWKMHVIDNPGYLLPNGLDAADLNNDNFSDYLTNYEWDGKIRIAFYPDIMNVRSKWPAITIGSIPNAENAAFGDFDNDGNIDVVVVHGEELSFQAGVLIIWGPSHELVETKSAWKQSKDIPATIGIGHVHYVRSHDVNGDNATDIIIGGRGMNSKVGLKWIKAPKSTGNYKNLSEWEVYNIDPYLESGHGFEFGDIDQDGDEDIVLCNSDWDTLDEEEMVIWYENPGSGTPEQENPWEKHVIYQGSEFYSKEQVSLHDFNGDSYPEVIMQTPSHIYIFKNPQIDTDWELFKIKKPEITRWRARTISIGDYNNDSKMDIGGMLIHRDGYLPSSKASVFWMEYQGSNFETGDWITHVIKWGDNFNGIGMYNGEKWDQSILEDLDRDGDLDIVANCEEFHSLGFVFISVVWFENPRF
jgi:hypothetical protein